jgi:hypothetical protein
MDRLAMLERMMNGDLVELPLMCSPEHLQELQDLYQEVRLSDPVYLSLSNKKSMNLKFINIVDPTFPKNNLGKSISRLNSSRIKCGLKIQQKKLAHLYKEALELEYTKG